MTTPARGGEADLRVGFSASHGSRFDEKFVSWTVEQLAELDYFRFELCRENAGVDRWIEYRALPKLNAHKPHDPAGADALRRALAPVAESGRQVSLWTHELWAPDRILDFYPELRTRRGDIDLSHPLMTEFVLDKYERLFKTIPELGALTLTLTETAFPVMHRFDNEWTPEQCVAWLVGTLDEVCAAHGRALIVRPFSAIRADYEAVRRALLRLPASIEIMLKTDPFDWDPFLPFNPAMHTYPPERLTAEFDLAGEYFGRGALPVIFPDYIRERMDAVRRLGIPRAVGRVDRCGVSALDREGRLNVDLFCAAARSGRGNAAAKRSWLVQRCRGYYPGAVDASTLVTALETGFEAVKKLFYTDGHLLFHRTFGDLRLAQTNVLFETLRPEQPLDHCADEWHILSDRVSPSVEQARAEKDEAIALAEKARRLVAAAAPGHELLREHAENLVLFARLYRAAVEAIQEYVLTVRHGDAGSFAASCARLDESVQALREARGMRWNSGLARTAAGFARDLRRAHELEQEFYRALPGLTDAERARLLDAVPAGYPGEGHRLRKFTHGSTATMTRSGFYRTVDRYVGYTLSGRGGPARLALLLSGAGVLHVRQQHRELSMLDWDHGERWRKRHADFEMDDGPLELRIDRTSGARPRVKWVYLITDPTTRSPAPAAPAAARRPPGTRQPAPCASRR